MDKLDIGQLQKTQISKNKAIMIIAISLLVLIVVALWTYQNVYLAVWLSKSEARELQSISCPILTSGMLVGSSDSAPNGPIYQLQKYLSSARVRASYFLPNYNIQPSGTFDDPTRLTLEAFMKSAWRPGRITAITPDIIRIISNSCQNIKTQ